jgi:anaphase-promoting complex subunit 8
MGLFVKKKKSTKTVIFIIYVENSNKIRSHPEIQLLDRELKKLYQEKRLNGLNLYLYGLILKEQQRLQEAKYIFI